MPESSQDIFLACLDRQPKIAWNHCPPYFEPSKRAGLFQCLCQCVFPASPPRSTPGNLKSGLGSHGWQEGPLC